MKLEKMFTLYLALSAYSIYGQVYTPVPKCSKQDTYCKSSKNTKIKIIRLVSSGVISNYCSDDVLDALLLVLNSVQPKIDVYTYPKVFQPLKKQIAQARNTLTVYGTLHIETHKAFAALIEKFAAQKDYLNTLVDTPELFEVMDDLNLMIMELERNLNK